MSENEQIGEMVTRSRDYAARITALRAKINEMAGDLQQIAFALKDWSRSRPETSGPMTIAFTTSVRTGGQRAEFSTSFGQEIYDDLASLEALEKEQQELAGQLHSLGIGEIEPATPEPAPERPPLYVRSDGKIYT